MSHPQFEASPTPTKHRSGFIRAFSNFSKPVEEWGVGNVPVLSPSVTPRRERASATRSRPGSNNSSTTFSPRRPDSMDVFESPSRVPPIRPLSVATVSTFGGWISERVDEDEEVEDIFTVQNAETLARKPSGNAFRQHAQPVLSVQHKYTVLQPRSVSVTGNVHRGLATNVHPLRMHPPSPSLSLPARAESLQSQNTSLSSRSPSEMPLPSIPSFDDAASRASRETISTRRSRRTLRGLDIEAANSDAKPHVEELQNMDNEQAQVAQSNVVHTDKHSSFLRDVGYVEAMRLWYEEKENEASKTSHCERKAARRAGTDGCALASVNANQRL